ncbi:MAG: PadR family transcriptional regulator [Thermosynechococcaceae cyanobacterium]
MSLAYAILAALTEAECSGYDLAKTFDGSIGYFWAATHQQIYRELAHLESEGWVTSQTIEQTERPNKKLFSLTPLGRSKLTEWIAQPSKASKHKEEILVKLFAGHLAEPAVLIIELQRVRQHHQQQLQEYRQIEAQFFAPPLTYGAKCQYLTLRQGIRYETSWLDWCDEAIALLNSEA